MSMLLRGVRTLNHLLSPLGVRLARAAPQTAAAGHAPLLTLPAGVSRARLLKSLTSVMMNRPDPAELRAYAEADCDRFVYTLGMVPDGTGRALEVGANPYFTTILLKQFRQYDLTMTNFFSGPVAPAAQDVSYQPVTGARVSERFDYLNVNVETDKLPYGDGTFDLALFCEVLEHMTNDPLAALAEIKRVLRRGGQLIVTTPNVARVENVARLIAGDNMYDPYSGYGPYGRHNREYTVAELDRLMRHCGFEPEIVFTADVGPPVHDQLAPAATAAGAARATSDELGQYIFSRWRNASDMAVGRPPWLYRSYAAEAEEAG